MTLILTGCQTPIPSLATTMNETAVLTGNFATDPIGWKVITSGLNLNDATMFRVFANDSAARYSRTM